eukprot:scaffold16445_cov33-Tisochrysis_lutea.AAC.4
MKLAVCGPFKVPRTPVPSPLPSPPLCVPRGGQTPTDFVPGHGGAARATSLGPRSKKGAGRGGDGAVFAHATTRPNEGKPPRARRAFFYATACMRVWRMAMRIYGYLRIFLGYLGRFSGYMGDISNGYLGEKLWIFWPTPTFHLSSRMWTAPKEGQGVKEMPPMEDSRKKG